MKSATPSPLSAEIMKVSLNWDALVALARQLEQALLLDAVDLVQHQHQRLRACPSSLVQDALDLLVQPLGRIDQQGDDVGIAGAAPGRVDHGPVEAAARSEDAGRIDEHQLARALDGDAAHRHARRLHLVADDADLGADQGVDQRRLAGVGRADDGDEAEAGFRSRRRCHSSRSLIVVLSARLRARAAPWRRPARRRACWHLRRARAWCP